MFICLLMVVLYSIHLYKVKTLFIIVILTTVLPVEVPFNSVCAIQFRVYIRTVGGGTSSSGGRNGIASGDWVGTHGEVVH